MLGTGYFRNPHIFSRCLNLCAKYWLYKYSLYYFCCSCFPSFVSFFELKLFKENYSNCIMSLDWLKNTTRHQFWTGLLLQFGYSPQGEQGAPCSCPRAVTTGQSFQICSFSLSLASHHRLPLLPPSSQQGFWGVLLYDLTATKLVPLALYSIIYPFSTQEKKAEKANSWGRHESHRETMSLLLPHQKKKEGRQKRRKEKRGKEVRWEEWKKEGIFFVIEDPYFDPYHDSLTFAFNEHSIFLSLCCFTVII